MTTIEIDQEELLGVVREQRNTALDLAANWEAATKRLQAKLDALEQA